MQACHPDAGRPPPFGVIRKPRRLDFGEDGPAQRPADRADSSAAPTAALSQQQRSAVPAERPPPATGSQRSGSASMVELEDISFVPEDLRRQSESGSLPVSLKALQASGAGRGRDCAGVRPSRPALRSRSSSFDGQSPRLRAANEQSIPYRTEHVMRSGRRPHSSCRSQRICALGAGGAPDVPSGQGAA